MLVLAGPGSGKTFVITRRILHLIRQHHVKPESILVITFTRAAALEMKERFLSLCDGESLPVQFGTFHAIFFSILKEKFHYCSADILKSDEKIKILSEVIHLEQIHIPIREELLEGLLAEFSAMHNTGKSAEDFHSLLVEQEDYQRIYNAYTKMTDMLGKLDFDSMIIQCKDLLEKDRELLQKWQSRFEYILIDEFQDISPNQYEIIKQLGMPQNNLFIVGDDDQSIYGFRGASPDIMFRFKEDYPDCQQLFLNVNYRCSGNIVKAAGEIIAENNNRFEKEIIPVNPPGDKIKLIAATDKGKEYKLLAEYLWKEKQQNNLHNCAVICRTSQYFPMICHFLKQNGIECNCKERKNSIRKDEVTLDIMAYLKIAYGNRERKNLFRIMNKPLRYIEREDIGEVFDLNKICHKYEGKPYIQKRITELDKDLNKISRMSLFLGINYIRKKIGYDECLKSKYYNDSIKLEEKLSLCDMIQELSKGCEDINQLAEMIKASEGNAAFEKQTSNQLMLLTLHGSKGLEFEKVFLMDCNEQNIPHHKARTPNEIEEERRMFYVGMTRAQKNLFLFYTTGSKTEPVKPSRFLKKMLSTNSFSDK